MVGVPVAVAAVKVTLEPVQTGLALTPMVTPEIGWSTCSTTGTGEVTLPQALLARTV